MRSMLASCLVLGLLACKADIPDGAYVCANDDDCPHGFVCRARNAESELFCFADAADAGDRGDDMRGGAVHDAGATDGGNQGGDDASVDAGAPHAGEPGFEVRGAGFWSGGEVQSAGRYSVHDDGFDRGQRLCTAGRELCVTGGFTP